MCFPVFRTPLKKQTKIYFITLNKKEMRVSSEPNDAEI